MLIRVSKTRKISSEGTPIKGKKKRVINLQLIASQLTALNFTVFFGKNISFLTDVITTLTCNDMF